MHSHNNIFLVLLAGSSAVLTVLVATPWVIHLAHRLDALDHPGGRRVHGTATPRMGGLAIAIGALAGVLAVLWVPGIARPGHTPLGAVFLASCGIVALGFWDDFRQVPAHRKLILQIGLASLCWFGGVRVGRIGFPNIGLIDLPVAVGFLLTVSWIVGITNAINLLDGLDGLAAGVVAIVTATVMMAAVMSGQTSVFLMLTTGSLCAACLGFLFFNCHPARIFMGDTGSLFLGFLLANLSVLSFNKGTTATALAIPILALGVPISDTLLAVTRRLLKGRSPFVADRHHLHHVLWRVGLTTRKAVMIIHCGTGILCACSLLSVLFGIKFQMLGYVILLAGLAALYVRVRRHDEEQSASAPESGAACEPGEVVSPLLNAVND